MRWPAYPEYRDSGVEWLPSVPRAWRTSPLGYLVRFHGGATPDKGKPEYWDGEIPWVSPKDMKQSRLADAEDHISRDGLANSPLSMVPPESVLIVVRGMILAHSFPVAMNDAPVTINQDMKSLTAGPALWPSYLSWAMQGLGHLIVSLADESAHGTKKIETSTLARLQLPVPTIIEQRAIADFLDAQTARLDTLIEKKRTLIEKLREKRLALISRTVAQGLPSAADLAHMGDSQTALRPSGIEWLDEVPWHWEVKPIKVVAVVGNGSTPNREDSRYWKGSYPWLNSSVVNEHAVSEPSDFVTEVALRECHLPKVVPPAVLVGITGEGRTRGLASILIFEATINQHLAFIKPMPQRCDARFLRLVLTCAYSYMRDESDGSGSTKGAITCEQLANMRVPLPPLSEQRAIVDFLDRETAHIDRLVERIEQAIETLREYRAALITAAVTGKIDVRGYASVDPS